MVNYKEIPGFEKWLEKETFFFIIGGEMYYDDGAADMPEICKLALVKEYLREAHGLLVETKFNRWYSRYYFDVFNKLKGKDGVTYYSPKSYDSYSKTLKEGIKEAIKLIPKNK